MIECHILKQEDKDVYINFLVDNFAENQDPSALRLSAAKEVGCMFSDYFRKPVFYDFYQDGERIGASSIIREWIAPNTWSISWVCTRKDLRGQGIGTHILESTIEDFAENQLNGAPCTLMLYCLEQNCAFYEQFGFEKGPQGHRWFFMSKKVNA